MTHPNDYAMDPKAKAKIEAHDNEIAKFNRQAREDALLAQIQTEPDQAKRAELSRELYALLNTPEPQQPEPGSDTKARIFVRDLLVYSSYIKKLSR